MKKYNLFKVLAITVLVAWLLTLFIPGSSMDYSGNIVKGSIAGVGVWQLLSNLSISISYFNGIAVFLIAIACFYAVLSKVVIYENFVKKTASIFENRKGLLVIISIILFGVLACVVNDWMILFIFIPFVYKVMKLLEINKKAILSSTVVASLLGAMCGIYNDTLFTMFGLKVNTLLLVKIVLLIISLAILVFFTAPKKSKKAVKEVKTETKKEEKKVSSKAKTSSAKKTTTTKKATASKKAATTKETTKKATSGKKVAK